MSATRFTIAGLAVVAIVGVGAVLGTSAGSPAPHRPVVNVIPRDDVSTEPPSTDAPVTDPAASTDPASTQDTTPMTDPTPSTDPTIVTDPAAPTEPTTIPAAPPTDATTTAPPAETPPPTVCYPTPPQRGIPYDPNDPNNRVCQPA